LISGPDRDAGSWDALLEAAPHVGHYAIRSRGTFGGSLAHADPTAEFPLVALTLGAEIVALSTEGARTIAADLFFEGVFSTALRPDELLTEVRLPAPPPGAVTAFEEFAERSGDFALASVCVGIDPMGARPRWVRVGLGAVGPAPLRSLIAEEILSRSELSEEAIEVDPPGDFHASSKYRRDLVRILLRRALKRAIRRERAKGQKRDTARCRKCIRSGL
jgi:carbon-monoxide dehydrogenase medium subunit